MKIKYIHISAPNTEKIHDTQKALKAAKGFINAMGSNPSQEEYDEIELQNFERDKKRGIIIEYRIL